MCAVYTGTASIVLKHWLCLPACLHLCLQEGNYGVLRNRVNSEYLRFHFMARFLSEETDPGLEVRTAHVRHGA